MFDSILKLLDPIVDLLNVERNRVHFIGEMCTSLLNALQRGGNSFSGKGGFRYRTINDCNRHQLILRDVSQALRRRAHVADRVVDCVARRDASCDGLLDFTNLLADLVCWAAGLRWKGFYFLRPDSEATAAVTSARCFDRCIESQKIRLRSHIADKREIEPIDCARSKTIERFGNFFNMGLDAEPGILQVRRQRSRRLFRKLLPRPLLVYFGKTRNSAHSKWLKSRDGMRRTEQMKDRPAGATKTRMPRCGGTSNNAD